METNSQPQVNSLSSIWCKNDKTAAFPRIRPGRSMTLTKNFKVVFHFLEVKGQFYWDIEDRESLGIKKISSVILFEFDLYSQLYRRA